VELDLREAVLGQQEVTIQLAVILGGVDITLPHGVRVVNNTSAILGGADLHGTDQVVDPNVPVVRLTGPACSGVSASRPRDRDARKAARKSDARGVQTVNL